MGTDLHRHFNEGIIMRKRAVLASLLVATLVSCLSYQVKTQPSFYDIRDKYQGTVGCYVSDDFQNYIHKGPGWTVTPGANSPTILLKGLGSIANTALLVDSPSPSDVSGDYLFTVVPSFRSTAWDEVGRNWLVEVQFDLLDPDGRLLDRILISSYEDVNQLGSIAPDWGMNAIYQDGMAAIAKSEKVQQALTRPTLMAAAPTGETTPQPPPTDSNVSVVEGRRVALVIGNSRYRDAPLRNPVNDAQDIAALLRRVGFDVILETDADLRTMERSIDAFYNELQGTEGIGFFYYAGHGIQMRGHNYLVPVDATLTNESDTKYECVDAGVVLGKMEDAGNGANVVVLDACRNNPFAASFRSLNRGLARIDAPAGSILAYATAPGSVAADGTGRNGTYTRNLLQFLAIPGITIEEVLKRVRVNVMKETGGKQIPWESSSLTGYLYIGK